MAAGLAVTATALVAAGPGAPERTRGHPVADPVRGRRAVQLVAAPVRIADEAAVRLLRPGDRVDVIAAEEGETVRVVASGARVTKVPLVTSASAAMEPGGDFGEGQGGALVVLSVPRETAARLAGAGATSRLAVTLC